MTRGPKPSLPDALPVAPRPWEGYAAGVRLRGYQERALAAFRQVVLGLAADDPGAAAASGAAAAPARRSFHLVAPPGAGKTLMGLLMCQELGRPAVCLSPNAAIQGQWITRLRQHWVCLDGAREAFQPSPVGADAPLVHGPEAPPQALAALTYQRLCVKDRGAAPAASAADTDADTDSDSNLDADDALASDSDRADHAALSLHPNVLALHQALADMGVGTVVLDECHHLGGQWGLAVEALCAALHDPVVIGLTATPVLQSDGPLARLLGPPDHEISLPSVIRSGDLAPFQDLCYIVPPSAEEEDDVQGCLGRFTRLWERLCRSDDARIGLTSTLDMLEVDPRLISGQRCDDLLDLLAHEPEVVAAWCRLRAEGGREPPAVLPYLPEHHEPPTLGDKLLLAARYTAATLLVEDGDPALADEAVEVLAEWGYRVSKGRVSRHAGRVSRRLGFTRRKLSATLSILERELTTMGADLRALVITDYERPPGGEEALSCLDVMDLLTSTPALDELDPILITGSSLLVDDDLWPRFSRSLEALRAQEGWDLTLTKERERGYWRVGGSGRHFNTRVQVRLVTHMLETGVSRCLIGTRALLGEGWDCLRLNTLVDLTVVTSGVAVNQIRGRSIRFDPQDEVKVANNWDVLCLSSVGDRADLDRLQERHGRLYGITDDGQVERGLGHIHPSFERVSPAELYLEREAINAMMCRRAADRLDARARWRVGRTFEDRDYHVLSFVARARPSAPAPRASQTLTPAADAPAPDGPPPAEHEALVLFPHRARAARRAVATTAGVGVTLAGGLLAAAALGGGPLLALGALIPAAAAILGARTLSRRRYRATGLAAELESLAAVLAAAYAQRERAACPTPELCTRDDGTVRVSWHGADPEVSERMSAALAELLGPVLSPRYLLEEQLAELPGGPSTWRRLVGPTAAARRVYAVPRMFGRKAASAALLACWTEHRNPAVCLHHVSSDRGAELLARHLRTRPLAGEAAIQTIWR